MSSFLHLFMQFVLLFKRLLLVTLFWPKKNFCPPFCLKTSHCAVYDRLTYFSKFCKKKVYEKSHKIFFFIEQNSKCFMSFSLNRVHGVEWFLMQHCFALYSCVQLFLYSCLYLFYNIEMSARKIDRKSLDFSGFSPVKRKYLWI